MNNDNIPQNNCPTRGEYETRKEFCDKMFEILTDNIKELNDETKKIKLGMYAMVLLSIGGKLDLIKLLELLI